MLSISRTKVMVLVGLLVAFVITLAHAPESHAQDCSGDRDCDGLSDADESWFINTFKPVLVFDEEEFKCLNPYEDSATLYQVTPLVTGRYEPNTVLVTIIVAYTEDCGGFGLGDPWSSHPGDLEMLRLIVTEDGFNPDTWYLDSILIKRHHDKVKAYDQSEFQRNGSNPIVYVSESKHAVYPSVGSCEGYGSWYAEYEDCGGGPSMNLYTPPEHNVGERDYPAFDQLWDSGSNALKNLFPYDFAWSPDYFCGGPEVMVGDCPGGFGRKWWIPEKQSEWDHQSNLIREALNS